MPGAVRPSNLVDVLQTMYSGTSDQSGVSTSGPTTVISLVGEADEQLTMADTTFALSKVPGGWNQVTYGGGAWS
jgi:hypothetical protein